MISPKLLRLNHLQREEAFDEARFKYAGPKPSIGSIRQTGQSKYPEWMFTLVISLCVIVLVASFTPSMFRLYRAGSDEFCKAWSPTPTVDPAIQVVSANDAGVPLECAAVGVSMIVLAEIGQIIFFLALAVLGSNDLSRKVFWGGVVISSAIAFVGNIHVAQPWNHGVAFGLVWSWVEAVAPSVVVMGVGYILKEILLHLVAERIAVSNELRQALESWEARVQEADRQGKVWSGYLSRALRAALEQVNSAPGRKSALVELTTEDWRQLIFDEMKAAIWIVDPTEMAVQARKADQPVEDGDSSFITKATADPEDLIEVYEDPGGQGWRVRLLLTKEVQPKLYKSRNHARAAGIRKTKNLLNSTEETQTLG